MAHPPLPAIEPGLSRPRNDPSPASTYHLQLADQPPVAYGDLQSLGVALRHLPGVLTVTPTTDGYDVSLSGVPTGKVWIIGGPGSLRPSGGQVGRPRIPDDQLKAKRRPNRVEKYHLKKIMRQTEEARKFERAVEELLARPPL